MYYFIYPNKDTYIYELNDNSKNNYGGDDTLKLKKDFDTNDLNGVTRILLHFDVSEFSSSLVNGDIPSITVGNSYQYKLRLFEKKTLELSSEYSLASFPLSQSWVEGKGYELQNPNSKDGVTWNRRDGNFTNMSWSFKSNNDADSGSRSTGGGVWITGSTHHGEQSFSYESPDVNMDVENIIKNWLGGGEYLPNNGLILKWSGSQEDSTSITGDINFHSRHGNSIYSPRIEIRVDDHAPASGSNTGSLTELDVSATNQDVYLYMTNLRSEYTENEIPKFRVGARNRYITKSTSTSYTKDEQEYVPETSGSYSIIDVETGQTLIPFDEYSYLSCDVNGSYFKQNLKTFVNNRTYRIKLKLQTSDNKNLIFDDGWDFKVVK